MSRVSLASAIFVGGAFGSLMTSFPSLNMRQILALSKRCLAKPATEDFASSSNDVA